MTTNLFNVRYIAIHVFPPVQWAATPYLRKKNFHHLVTATGKHILLEPLTGKDGCIEIAFTGNLEQAEASNVLFDLLLNLWRDHPEAKIAYARELYVQSPARAFLTAKSWLQQHLPKPLYNVVSRIGNSIAVQNQLPPIF